MEIERKWLLENFPSNAPYEQAYISTAYLYVSDSMEMRVRKRTNIFIDDVKTDYKMAIKNNGDMVREEFELSISESQYLELLESMPHKCISKDFRLYNFDDFKLETSHVDGEWFYAEIEFETEEEAVAFTSPDWFGLEVTFDSNYKMKNYWRQTRLGGY